MEETPLLHKPSIDGQVIKALKGFSIVESVIKTRDTLVIKVDDEQWIKLDKVQKNLFTKIVYKFVNANVTVENIYIKNKKGEILAYLQKGETGNNHMVVTDTVTEKLEAEKEQEAPFDLEKALSTEVTNLQNIAAVPAESAEKSAIDFTHQKDIPDITVKEFAPEPTPQPVLNQKPKYGALYKILIVFLVVIIAVAAKYCFSFKEPEPAKRSFVLPTNRASLMVPQDQTDKKNRVLESTVEAHKSAAGRQPEPDKKDASQLMAAPASLPASQTAAPPAHKEGTSSPAIKENKPADEKKVVAPPQQEAAGNPTMYCVNVASFKLRENADVAIKDLQKKGYEPAGDTIMVKDTAWYRVTLGHFQTQGEAQNYARELQRKENINGFVVKKKK